MNRYVNADLHRIITKRRYLLMVLLEFVIAAAAAVIVSLGGADSYTESISTYINYLPLIFGLPLFVSIFSMDVRARTFETAVVRGVRRGSIVIGKFVEVLLLALINFAIVGAILYAVPAVMTTGIGGSGLKAIIFLELGAFLETICFAAISMIPMLGGLSPEIGSILYVLLSTEALNLLITKLLSLSILPAAASGVSLGLLTNLVTSFTGTLMNDGTVEPVRLVLILVIYIVLPLLITAMAFRKKKI